MKKRMHSNKAFIIFPNSLYFVFSVIQTFAISSPSVSLFSALVTFRIRLGGRVKSLISVRKKRYIALFLRNKGGNSKQKGLKQLMALKLCLCCRHMGGLFMSRQCCQRWTGKLVFRGSLLSDCFYGILARKIVVYVANCNGNNQFAPVCISRHVLAVFVGSFGSQLFFSLTRAMNRNCWPVDIDLDLRLLEFLQKRSCERFVLDLHNSPVALELCLNKFGRSPTGKRYQLQTRTVTVEEMANDFFL